MKAQFDVFDNYVLGSTPEGFYLNGQPSTPDLLSRSSRAPIRSPPRRDAIRSRTPSASSAPGPRCACPSASYALVACRPTGASASKSTTVTASTAISGVNVDRVMFVTREPWAKHFFAFLWDWAATGPTTRLYTPNQSNGPVYNADRLDDVMQWGLAVGKQDKPEDIKEKLDKVSWSSITAATSPCAIRAGIWFEIQV